MEKGTAKIIATDHTQDDGAKIPKGPCKLTDRKDGGTASQEIYIETSRAVEVKL